MSNRPLIGKKKILSKKVTAAKSSGAAKTIRKEPVVPKKEKFGEKGVLRCTGCGAVYFDKHWHGKGALKGLINEAEMVDALCDVCPRKSSKVGTSVSGFGGELVIEGIPSIEAKSEILSLIRNASNRAQAKDPMERVMRIEEQGKKMMVYVSENQLAVGLGKQLHSAMKGGTLTITWSDVDKPVRVHWIMKMSGKMK